MNFWEGIKMAWASIKSNKMRSFLTALGIIFGVGAVIAMVSVAQGASRDITAQIESMGSNMITVMPNRGSGISLKMEDAEELLERVPTITEAVPVVNLNATVKWETNTYDAAIEGVGEGYPRVRNLDTGSGRFFTADEVANRTPVALIGETVITELFEGKLPLGEKINIKGQYFTVIGVLESKGSSMGQDNDDTILIPVTLAQRLSLTTDVNTIYLKAKSGEEAELAVAHVTSIYYQKYKRENMVRVMSQDEMLSTINSTTQTFALMLGAIAGISLLVGGIGIMNIMLVSVTERTREIGIRKALGAKRSDILQQFLVESIFLSVGGGVIGIVAGIGVSLLISILGGWTTAVSPASVLISFTFAFAVGLFFGGYPAYKAAKLDPIVALRHE